MKERRTEMTYLVSSSTYGDACRKAMVAAEVDGFGVPRVVAWNEVGQGVIVVTIEEYGF